MDFPLYAYIPGRFPHPRTNVDGHSHGKAHPSEGAFDHQNWQKDGRWLYAVDLYNAGFFWESHEYWEALWHSEDHVGPVALLLKALIQTAAAHIKAIDGNLKGVEILAARSDQMFADLKKEGHELLLGLSLDDFRLRRNNWFAHVLQEDSLNAALFPFVHLNQNGG